MSPLTNPFSSGLVLGDISQRAVGAFGTIQAESQAFLAQPDAVKLGKALEKAMAEVNKARSDISGRFETARYANVRRSLLLRISSISRSLLTLCIPQHSRRC